MKTVKAWQTVVAFVVFTAVLAGAGAGAGVASMQPATAQQPQAPVAQTTVDTALVSTSQPAPAVSDACARALETVQQAGLRLASRTEFRCPGNTETTPGDRQHSGVACFDHRRYCPQSSFIAINPEQIGSGDQGMRYVIAHEICHIESYVATGTPGPEEAADACAATAGFPR